MAEKKNGFIFKAATFIVDKRNVFFLLYAFAFLFCIFAMGWVHVENDVTKYLPEDVEIRQGYETMNQHFTVTGMGRVMVSNITYDTAEELFEDLSAIEGITMVTFDDTQDHYRDASALYDLNFDGGKGLAAFGGMICAFDGRLLVFYLTVGVGLMLLVLLINFSGILPLTAELKKRRAEWKDLLAQEE